MAPLTLLTGWDWLPWKVTGTMPVGPEAGRVPLVGEATGLLTGIFVGVLVGVSVGLLVGVLVGVIVGVLVRPYFVDSRHEIEIWRIWSPRKTTFQIPGSIGVHFGRFMIP
jgi:hypothetical protein